MILSRERQTTLPFHHGLLGSPASFALLLFVLLPALPTAGPAAELQPTEVGGVALWQSLLELRTTAVALHITAHPDDEDGPTVTYLSKAMGARTLLLAVNRGEGGADLIAPYASDALGILRTLEMIEAARRYGAEPFFTRLVDFGYSKSVDEVLEKWGEENIVRDAVRVIRRERPDVVFSRFRGDPREGHATTYVVDLMARRAFAASADPTRFPEQIQEGLRPFQAKKLYIHNQRPDGEPRLPDLTTVVVPTGDLDPIRGRSYFELAREGYFMHRTQGTFDRLTRAGTFDVHYQLVQSSLPAYAPKKESSFFDGLDTTIEGIAASDSSPPAWLREGLHAVGASVERAVGVFDPRSPERTVEPLVVGLKATRALLERLTEIDEPAREEIARRLERKEDQFQRALGCALSLDLEASVVSTENGVAPFRVAFTFNHAVPGEAFDTVVRLLNRSRLPIVVQRVEIEAPSGWAASSEAVEPAVVRYNESFSRRFRVQVAARAALSRPYWRRDSIDETAYSISNSRWATYALPEPPVWGAVTFDVAGATVKLRTPLRVTRPNPPEPALNPPLTVAPAISVRFASPRGVIRHTQRGFDVSVVVRSSVKSAAEGSVALVLPAGWTSTPTSSRFVFNGEDEEAAFRFRVSLPRVLGSREEWLRAVAHYQGQEFIEGYRTITSKDLGRFNYYEPARHLVRGVPVEAPSDLLVGYVMGATDSVPTSLAQIGIVPTLLNEADLATGNLDRFDSIVMGIRSYTLRPDVATHNARLLNYVREGGVLIVQYQTPEFDHDFGPYPYSMTRSPEEVSEEASRVEILDSKNPLFVSPNPISLADFDNWIEERGSKFMASWDPRYQALIETHDRGQKAQRGGWLYARYGKGVYIYCAYAFHRQLPHGVPGAFRLYVNMLALRRTLAEHH